MPNAHQFKTHANNYLVCRSNSFPTEMDFENISGTAVAFFNHHTYRRSPRWIELLAGTWIVCLHVGGVFLNGIVLYVFIKERKTINNNHILPFTITLNGFFMAVGFVIPATAEFTGGILQNIGKPACMAEAFTVYFLGLAILLNNTAIAIHRYLLVSRPISSSQTSKLSMVAIAGVCEGCALLLALCPLLGWGSYGADVHGTSCGLDWRDRSIAAFTYLIFILVVCFLLPVATITFTYTSIYKAVRRSNRTVHRHGIPNTAYNRRKDNRIIKLGIVMVAVFMLCWTPYAIVSFWVVFGSADNIHPLITRSVALFAKSEVIWNPIVFVLIIKKFRHKVIILLSCKRIKPQRIVHSPTEQLNLRQLEHQSFTVQATNRG